ncbi:MAG: SAM-dependent methyltransferase [Pseudomonadota bacterium]
MTPLAIRLAKQIRSTGPIPVHAFMAQCLSDPVDGYYMTRDPLGREGDFTTAPEISQMFGEMLGLWAAEVWDLLGRPSPVVLTELGPGRGTLMADALRAARAMPEFVEAAEVWMVETSPTLRAAQHRALPEASWTDTLEGLPPGPMITFANEFFDALPVRQYLRRSDGWSERLVCVDAGALVFGETPPLADAQLDHRFGTPPEGAVVEVCPPGEAYIAALAAREAVVLALDYGAWGGTGDTLQAVRAHAYADILRTAGTADLTAHVDFRALAGSAQPLRAQFTTQGAFLERLGVTARAQMLARKDPDKIAAQHRRLTHPDEMGTLFKALALRPATLPPVPGFPPPP